MAELSVFAYPWDIADDGPERVVEQLVALGVDRIEVATAYHSVETIRPRRSERVHVIPEGNVAHLPIGLSRFGRLVPAHGVLAVEQPALFERLATSAAAAGIALSGWTIMLHNSALATAVPDAALENCFGDRSGHGLCPLNPAVQEYARALAASIAATGYFDELLLESLAFLPAGHGHPHQLWAVRLDLLGRTLLSLCFCPSCLDRGAAAEIDGPRLRERVREELDSLWNSPSAGSSPEDEGAELTAAIAREPDLAAWTRMRMDAVTELSRTIVTDLDALGTGTVFGAAIWAREASTNWLEGIDLAALGELDAGIALMPYYVEAAAVARDLDVATGLAPAAGLQLVQTISPLHHSGLAALAQKVKLGRERGIERFGLYNFGMAARPQLEWVGEIARLLHSAT